MSGARPSTFKKGGGFLNNVDGVIVNYEFTTEFPNPNNKPRKPSKSDFTPLYASLRVRVDGADDESVTTIFVGSADDFEIEDDGHTLTPVEDGTSLWASADWSRFIASMCENGFDENELPEDSINFEAIIDRRCRFTQVKDAEKTARAGKRKDKKTGKEYDQQYLAVSQVYPASAKASVKASAAPTKGSKKAAAVDYTEADEALVALLDKKFDGKVDSKKKLVSAPGQLFLKKNYADSADEYRKLFTDGDYLAGAEERGAISIDGEEIATA